MSMVARGAIALLLVAVVVVVYQLAPGDWFDAAVTWSRENPTAGAAVYIAIGSLAAIAFVPGSVTIAAMAYALPAIVPNRKPASIIVTDPGTNAIAARLPIAM